MKQLYTLSNLQRRLARLRRLTTPPAEESGLGVCRACDESCGETRRFCDPCREAVKNGLRPAKGNLGGAGTGVRKVEKRKTSTRKGKAKILSRAGN